MLQKEVEIDTIKVWEKVWLFACIEKTDIAKARNRKIFLLVVIVKVRNQKNVLCGHNEGKRTKKVCLLQS